MKYTSAQYHQCYLPVLELYKGFQDIQKLSRDYDSTYFKPFKILGSFGQEIMALCERKVIRFEVSSQLRLRSRREI